MVWDQGQGVTMPKKGRQVTVRLTHGMGEALAARAAHEGADRSEVVRQALAHALAWTRTANVRRESSGAPLGVATARYGRMQRDAGGRARTRTGVVMREGR